MRSVRIIIGIVILAIIFGCILFYFGPPGLQAEVTAALQPSTGPQVSSSGSVSFEVLAQGQDALSLSDRTNYRIDSNKDFNALWLLVYGDKNPPPLPAVDFSKYEVLGVFDGTHSTSGYGIEVRQIMDKNLTRTVTIDHLAPSSSCATKSGVTSPFQIIEVPKTSDILAHEDLTAVANCPGN